MALTGTNLNTFSRRIRARANGLGNNLTKMVRRVALIIDGAVVISTPIDTGRAKSNWIVQMNHGASNVIGPYAPGEGGSTEAANISAATAQAEAVIAGYESGRDWEIYISNNVEYIGDLNRGTSAQAGENFVEEAIALGVAAARRARL